MPKPTNAPLPGIAAFGNTAAAMIGTSRSPGPRRTIKPTTAGARSSSIGRAGPENPATRRRSRAPTRTASGTEHGAASRASKPGLNVVGSHILENVLPHAGSSERMAPTRRGAPDLVAPGTPRRSSTIDISSVDHLKQQWERASQKAKESRERADAREAELERFTQALQTRRHHVKWMP